MDRIPPEITYQLINEFFIETHKNHGLTAAIASANSRSFDDLHSSSAYFFPDPIKATTQDTPLHVAVQRGEPSIVEILIRHGADVTLKCSMDKTAKDVAIDMHKNYKKMSTRVDLDSAIYVDKVQKYLAIIAML
jgi:ankyrin repeat protein